jgi:hypothetical protein
MDRVAESLRYRGGGGLSAAMAQGAGLLTFPAVDADMATLVRRCRCTQHANPGVTYGPQLCVGVGAATIGFVIRTQHLKGGRFGMKAATKDQ